MSLLTIELQKEKRTGVIPVLIVVGILGAAYALVNFFVRKNTLLSLPLAPMDVLLTQLYGTLLILNMFGIIVATCMIYNMEFKGNAVKKLYMLPVSVPKMYLYKFLILTILLLIAITLQNLALIKIGMTDLPQDTFELPIVGHICRISQLHYLSMATTSIIPPIRHTSFTFPVTMPLFTIAAVSVGIYNVPNTCANSRKIIKIARPL